MLLPFLLGTLTVNIAYIFCCCYYYHYCYHYHHLMGERVAGCGENQLRPSHATHPTGLSPAFQELADDNVSRLRVCSFIIATDPLLCCRHTHRLKTLPLFLHSLSFASPFVRQLVDPFNQRNRHPHTLPSSNTPILKHSHQ